MRWKIFRVGILWRLISALILAVCLVSISSNPVVALSVDDYFSYSYNVTFSKVEIEGSEVFTATIEVEATCENDLPVPASEASITSRVIAEHQVSGAKVTLNPSYTATIKPFPSQKGETSQAQQVVALQFPQGSGSGTYNIVGELTEAKVKVVVIWFNVTSYLPSTHVVGSLTYVSDGASPGGGGTAPPAPGLPPGTSDVSGFVSANGTFTNAVVVESEDGNCNLTIDKDATGLTENGNPLTQISILEIEDPPAPPEDSNIIGLAYDLGPDQVTFEPAVTLTFTYNPEDIPAEVSEHDLFLAYWDGDKWVTLPTTVNTTANTVTAEITHFTTFAILSILPPTPTPTPTPASFSVSDLSVSPAEVDIGKEVTISVLITNTGNLAGSYEVTLKIDEAVVATEEVTLDGGASQKVTFTTAKDVAGTYTVNVNGLTDTIAVKAEATPVTPPVIPPIPTKPINWWLIGGIIAAVIVIGTVISLVAMRQRA